MLQLHRSQSAIFAKWQQRGPLDTRYSRDFGDVDHPMSALLKQIVGAECFRTRPGETQTLETTNNSGRGEVAADLNPKRTLLTLLMALCNCLLAFAQENHPIQSHRK